MLQFIQLCEQGIDNLTGGEYIYIIQDARSHTRSASDGSRPSTAPVRAAVRDSTSSDCTVVRNKIHALKRADLVL